jgi:hypothetical protein
MLFCHSGLNAWFDELTTKGIQCFFMLFPLLDAGSVIPDLIRDRHDGQKLDCLLSYNTASKKGDRGIFYYAAGFDVVRFEIYKRTFSKTNDNEKPRPATSMIEAPEVRL